MKTFCPECGENFEIQIISTSNVSKHPCPHCKKYVFEPIKVAVGVAGAFSVLMSYGIHRGMYHYIQLMGKTENLQLVFTILFGVLMPGITLFAIYYLEVRLILRIYLKKAKFF